MAGFQIYCLFGIELLIIYILSIVGYQLYVRYGYFKVIFHDTFGLHIPDNTKGHRFDGVNYHRVCKHCGKDIMMDSHGNWF